MKIMIKWAIKKQNYTFLIERHIMFPFCEIYRKITVCFVLGTSHIIYKYFTADYLTIHITNNCTFVHIRYIYAQYG